MCVCICVECVSAKNWVRRENSQNRKNAKTLWALKSLTPTNETLTNLCVSLFFVLGKRHPTPSAPPACLSHTPFVLGGFQIYFRALCHPLIQYHSQQGPWRRALNRVNTVDKIVRKRNQTKNNKIKLKEICLCSTQLKRGCVCVSVSTKLLQQQQFSISVVSPPAFKFSAVAVIVISVPPPSSICMQISLSLSRFSLCLSLRYAMQALLTASTDNAQKPIANRVYVIAKPLCRLIK